MASSVAVLNVSYEPHQTVSYHHALRMLFREVAVVHEANEGWAGPYPRPRVIRLVTYLYIKRKNGAAINFSKKSLLKRDEGLCAYCLGEGTTVDHVIPRSQGGLTTWNNTVTACFPCNNRKGARTPDEAGMPLLFRPWDPNKARG